ncbi:MAG: VTT domain-containing protein [Coxiellaceae bacterium]|nr:VTT domain-containing protein [Coxiellaceae bacterium]
MLSLHDFNIHAVANFFSAHPHSFAIFVYFIVFAEAMAVIGAIVPGAIIMPAIGFLIGSAIVPAGSTFIWVILGAITGDCLSYFIGVYFQNRIHKIWPFTRWPNLLSQSEAFFHDHGGKSVFIGRFVGPTRAMIPMIAGMLKMPFIKFILVALPSATIWALGYIVPGILLGALSLELPPKVAAMFTFGVLLAAIVLWIVVWLIQLFFRGTWKLIDYYIKCIWKYCIKHKPLFWVTKLLSDPKEPDNHQQLTLLIGTIFSFLLFLLILYQVLTVGLFVNFARSIYYLLRSIRSEVLDHIFVLITLFGDLPFLLVTSGVIFLWLQWKKYKYTAFHWLGIIVLSGAVISSMKLFMYSPRPGDILYDVYASSFPSAHVVLGIALYGFLAVIIARELKDSKRYLVYIITSVFLASLAFSRIYLGAHWLIDIFGGIFLGLTILLLVTISYRRRHVLHFHTNKFVLVVCSVFVMVWLGYGVAGYSKKMQEYSLVWPTQVISFNRLVRENIPKLPVYCLNRFGRPIEALNIIYVGELTKIGKALSKEGWESQRVTLDFQGVLKNLFTTSVIHHLSLFPQLYHNKRMVLLYTKSTDVDGVVLILRLWSSDIDLKDSSLPLWVGTVEYHKVLPYSFSLKAFSNKHSFVGATDFLAKSLVRDFYLWKRSYSVDEQPSEMKDLQWDGKMLIIKSRGRGI